MKKTALLKTELMDRLELPEELRPNTARLMISGGRRALIENCRGVLEYSAERAVLSLGRGKVCIEGTGLQIEAMNISEVLISGRIQSVEWE